MLVRPFHHVHLRLIVPFFVIVAVEATNLYFIMILKEMATSNYLLAWLGLEVFFSFIIGKISDNYCRKKILILTLGFTVISIFLLRFHLYLLALITNGIFGNISCVARAAFCDINIFHKRVPNIIDTFIVQGLTYVLLIVNFLYFPDYLFNVVFIFGILTFVLSIFFFKDFRDNAQLKKEISLKDFCKKFLGFHYLRIIIGMFIWIIIWNIILFYGELHLKQYNIENYFFFLTGSAFFVGTIIAKIYKVEPNRLIPMVFLLTLFLFFFDYIFYLITGLMEDMTSSMFLRYSMLIGIGVPLIYSYFGEKASIHEQGMVYGFFESVESAASFLGPVGISYVFPITQLKFLYFFPLLALAYLLSIKISSSKTS